MTLFHALPLAKTKALFIDFQQRSPRSLVVGLVLSVVAHLLFILFGPQPIGNDQAPGMASRGPLVVRLAPRAEPAQAAAPPQATPNPTPPPTPRRVIAANKPSPTLPPVPIQAEPVTPTPQPTPPHPLSFSEMIEARRRQQAEGEARANAEASAASRGPTDDERSRANIARNLSTLTQQGGTSGVFQITYKGTRTGTFRFRGWKNTPGSGWLREYEVDAGPQGNVELALVRKMIEVIREHYQGDFNWESHRLGRVVPLSARKEDTAGLEAFLMREFFEE